MAQYKPSTPQQQRLFPYGYGRYAVLGGFINGVLLICVAFMTCAEAVHRILHPQVVHTHRLLFVSICGLVVNVCGVVFFSSAHAHSHALGSGCDACGHNHSHDDDDLVKHADSNDSESGSTSFAAQSRQLLSSVSFLWPFKASHPHHHRDLNTHGLLLHMVADTLGSIAVIASSYLVSHYDLHGADSVISIALSVLIFLSAWPLVRNASSVLMQQALPHHAEILRRTLSDIESIAGVHGFSHERMWSHDGSDVQCALRVRISDGADEQYVLRQIQSVMRRNGVTDAVVQIEKREFQETLNAAQLQTNILFGPRSPVTPASGGGSANGGIHTRFPLPSPPKPLEYTDV
jgi:zinc transporter 5/7